jgi:hypothetical protein
MSSERAFLIFSACTDEPTVFLPGGEAEVPGGRDIAEAIAQLLPAAGLQPSSFGPRDYYAWEFTVRDDGQRTEVLLYDWEPWVLIFSDATGFIGRLRRRSGLWERVRAALAGAMDADARFTNLTWYSPETFPGMPDIPPEP